MDMNKAIGDILKDARTKQGLKLPDISTKLCISKTYLRALEGNDKENLPAQTFTIGFLRTYATHLGLDADEMVDKAKGAIPEEVPALEVNVPEKAHDSTMPSIMVLTFIAGTLGIIMSGYSYFASGSVDEVEKFQQKPQELIASVSFADEEQVVPAVSNLIIERVQAEATTTSTPVVEEVVVEKNLEEQPKANEQLMVQAEKPIGDFVEIRAVSDTWMMIASSDKDNLFDNIIHQGQTYRAPVGKGLFLTTGNAGGLEFFLAGEQLPVPSGHGTILNALAIDQVVLDPGLANSDKQELLP